MHMVLIIIILPISYLCLLNNSFSSWTHIKTGVPQGSILGPLLFNMYINDIFFFIKETELTNYADDNYSLCYKFGC